MLLLVLLGCLASRSPAEVPGANDPSPGARANPPDVTFTIAFAEGRSRFVQGEPIKVELAFSSTSPATWQLNEATYDRSGRLFVDKFEVHPDVPDPLADYFAGGPFMTGGMRGMSILSETPRRLTFPLNEWRRFDQPGTYWLTVTSHRVAHDTLEGPRTVPLQSNSLAFEVVAATEEEHARMLHDSTTAFDTASTSEARQDAAARLRFLGTTGALIAIAEHIGRDARADHHLAFGVHGSLNRAEAVRALEARIDTDTPVSLADLSTLADLRLTLDHPGLRRSLEEHDAAVDAYAARLAAALGVRSPSNRAVCVAGLYRLAAQRKQAPEWAELARAELPAVFREIPQREQMWLLEGVHGRLDATALAPTLVAIYDDPDTTPDIRGLALRVLIQGDPAEAKKRVIDAVGRGTDLGYFGPGTLEMLPDSAIPELEATLARRLTWGHDWAGDTMALVARYGTVALLPQVKRVWRLLGLRRGGGRSIPSLLPTRRARCCRATADAPRMWQGHGAVGGGGARGLPETRGSVDRLPR